MEEEQKEIDIEFNKFCNKVKKIGIKMNKTQLEDLYNEFELSGSLAHLERALLASIDQRQQFPLLDKKVRAEIRKFSPTSRAPQRSVTN